MSNTKRTEKLSAKKRAKLLAGRDFWSTYEIDGHVPSLTLTDGPTGLRKQEGSFDHLGISASVPATCFPCECTTGSTFDEKLVEMVGKALGEECREQDVDIVLGPGINIKRHPLGGRNFEYFSEDPLVSGKLGAAMVRGIQSTGTGACVKHFAANSQETGRMTTDSIIDDATLHSIYLKPFEIAVREGQPEAVMTAYNKLNGEYCSQNPWLLGKLREWGFDGLTVTDWGALSQSVPSVLAGLNLVMPGPRKDHIEDVARAYREGLVSADVLESASQPIVKAARQHASTRKRPCPSDHAEHLAIAQLTAEAGSVLLKNDGVLPLSRETRVAVIGEFVEHPRYQGSGSSKVNPIALDNALGAMREMGVYPTYARGYERDTGETAPDLLDEATTAAKDADVAIVFAGLPSAYESEGFDRKTMSMPQGMNDLIERVASANESTVVVLAGGAPMELPWADKVAAILMTYLPGCRGGHATANLLFGEANPCGRLAETWPTSIEATALGSSFPETDKQVTYVEGPFVGYRFNDASGVAAAYPFGFGLSYTTFKYSKLAVSQGKEGIAASLKVKNTGSVEGAEIVQVYIARKGDDLPVPPKALAGFAKVHLAPGKSEQVEIPLSLDAFSCWDADAGCAHVIAGEYEMMAAASSDDIRQTRSIKLKKGASIGDSIVQKAPTFDEDLLAQYFSVSPAGFDVKGFRQLYGRPFPKVPPLRPFTPDSRLSDLKSTIPGSILVSFIYTYGNFEFKGDPDMRKMLEAMFDFMPMRFMIMGGVPPHVIEALIDTLNGEPGKALSDILQLLKAKLS